MEFAGRQLGQQSLAGARTFVPDGRGQPADGLPIVPAGFLQLVDQEAQHVELADLAQPLGDFAQAPPQAVRRVGVKLQNGKNFAEAPRRDTGLVQRADVTLVEGM